MFEFCSCLPQSSMTFSEAQQNHLRKIWTIKLPLLYALGLGLYENTMVQSAASNILDQGSTH